MPIDVGHPSEGEADWMASYEASAGLSGMVSPSASNSKGLGTIQGIR
jgi:hypothetical protein